MVKYAPSPFLSDVVSYYSLFFYAPSPFLSDVVSYYSLFVYAPSPFLSDVVSYYSLFVYAHSPFLSDVVSYYSLFVYASSSFLSDVVSYYSLFVYASSSSKWRSFLLLTFCLRFFVIFTWRSFLLLTALITSTMGRQLISSFVDLIRESHNFGSTFGIYFHDIQDVLPPLAHHYSDPLTVCSSVVLRLECGNYVFISDAKIGPKIPHVNIYCSSTVQLMFPLSDALQPFFKHFPCKHIQVSCVIMYHLVLTVIWLSCLI
jgi:hypothetical protein